MIQVDEFAARRARQRSADGRFARAHHADQKIGVS